MRSMVVLMRMRSIDLGKHLRTVDSEMVTEGGGGSGGADAGGP